MTPRKAKKRRARIWTLHVMPNGSPHIPCFTACIATDKGRFVNVREILPPVLPRRKAKP